MPKNETYLTVTGEIRYNMTGPNAPSSIYVAPLDSQKKAKNITLYYLQPISVFLILRFSLSIPNFSPPINY